VAQNQRARGKFSHHFGQESIYPNRKNEVKQAILRGFRPILGRSEVTNVMPGCLLFSRK
jgi:hypothetical protein